MGVDDPRVALERLVALARRRANRRVFLGALADAALPALVAVLVARLAVLLLGVPPAAPMIYLPAGAAVAGVVILYRLRRLGDSDAALLLDRRAGTRERCVTGLRGGADVAADALRHVDHETVRRVLTFRPPRAALAGILVAGALAAVWLLPAAGRAPPTPERVMSEVVVPGGGGAGGGVRPDGAAERAARDIDRAALSRLVDRAAAAVPEGETAESIREARRALDRGDDREARLNLRQALARAAAAEGGEGGGAVERIRKALEASAAAARRPGRGRIEERVEWGVHASLVRRYHLAIEDATR